MAGAIAHCWKNAGMKCPATKYVVSIDNNILERRVVAMPAETMLPDEVVSPVRTLPQGQCPTMKAAGAFATANHKAWAGSSSSYTDDTSSS
jgi:hypothetical protein